MRAARTSRVGKGDRAATPRRGRRLAMVLVTVGVLAVPLASIVSLSSTASARTGHPAKAAAVCTNGTYTVKSGDSWARISSGLHVTMAAMLAANGATSGIVIHPGDVLCVPAGATSTPAAPTAPVTSGPAAPAGALGPAAIRQFPVQGTCWFADWWGAPRSGGRKHEGVDILAKIGQYVYAADDGTLTKQYIDAPGKTTGNGWRITRADGTYFFYGHMSAFAPGLTVGSTVAAGQIIGRVGMTGNAGVPHLHFEVHPSGGKAVDPTPIVKAVDGCAITAVPTQPGDAPVTTPAPPTTPAPATTAAPVTTPAPATTPAAPASVPDSQSSPVAVPGRWQFLVPATVYDSRGAKLVPGRPVTVSLAGARTVPADAPSVLVRVIARNVRSEGFVMVGACGAAPSGTVAVGPGQPDAGSIVVPVSGGSWCVSSTVALDVKVAVLAFQADSGAVQQLVDSRRVLDTSGGATIAANRTRGVSLAALGVAAGTTAVTVTVTVLGAKTGGAIGIGPCRGTPWIVPFGRQASATFTGVVPVNSGGLCITPTVAVRIVVDMTAVWAN